MKHWQNYSLENLTEIREGVLLTEEWKDIEGYEDYYQISSFGRVKAKAKEWVTLEKFGIRKEAEKILKGSVERGYIHFVFCVERKKKTVSAHRLVAKHFCSNPHSFNVVNHENSTPDDNVWLNLTWTTQKGNIAHCIEKGRKIIKYGESHHASKLSADDILKIRELNKTTQLRQHQIAKMFNVRQQQISRIINHERWSHIK